MTTADLDQYKENKQQYAKASDMFLVYTHVARMLAAEDIIVRWNVVGMEAPAAMNYATRVLDVAPIKPGCEDTIPGLILHEIGHFLFSENAAKSSTGDRFEIDVARLDDIRAKIKNHRIWNIVEDGFIERKVTQKWAGALKYFRVLYNNDMRMAAEYGEHPDRVVAIMNTLQLNCIGAKWNEVHAYPKGTPESLLKLLERARLITGNPDARCEIANKIAAALMQFHQKEVVKQVQNGDVEAAVKAAVKALAATESEDVDAEDMSSKGAGVGSNADGASGSGGGTLTEDTPASAADRKKISDQIEDYKNQSFVDQTLSADIIANNMSKGSEKKKEDAKEEEKKEDVVEEASNGMDDEDSVQRLEQHISDKKADLIGNNLQYLADTVRSSLSENESHAIPPIFIATPPQIAELSSVVDIFSDELQDAIKGVPFLTFTRTIEQNAKEQSFNRSAKKAISLFNSKSLTAKGVAQAMFQRFTTKANAINVSLTRHKQTGSLDPTRAALYKIYDDVFQRRRQAPQQINHGYVLMVDWSSSMMSSSMELFHRIAELVFFAQLANIEIDVWLYTTVSDSNSSDSKIIAEKLAQSGKRNKTDGILLLPSKMIHVLNTKQHSANELSYRLFGMFLNSYICAKRAWGYPDQFTYGSKAILNDVSFGRDCFHPMHGTNIFEAISFASTRIEAMQCDKKAIMLLTDGEDNAFRHISDFSKKSERDVFGSIKLPVSPVGVSMNQTMRPVIYNGVNINELREQLRRSGQQTNFKPLFSQLKDFATYLLCEDIRKLGVAIIGVTWGSYTNQVMRAWSKDNTIRIVTQSGGRSGAGEYPQVPNTFISKITDALLADLSK